MKRVLVCGGRGYDNRKELGSILSEFNRDEGIGLVISGGASGADRLAESWANHNRIPLCIFPANWNFEGRAAGPIRNGRMIEFGHPDWVIAFPGGAGTKNMIAQAESKNIPVSIVGSWSKTTISAFRSPQS